MTRPHATDVPGAPRTLSLKPEVILAEMGEVLEGEGVKVLMDAEKLIFMAAMDGAEMMLAIPVYKLLEAIQQVTSKES